MSGHLRCIALVAAVLAVAACGRAEPNAQAAFDAGDYTRSLALARAAAEKGDAAAQNLVGIQYHLGFGVERRLDEAARWYERAAVGGNADARRNLGTLYELGLGVPQDKLRAYSWYFAAVHQGQARAQSYVDAMANELTPNQIRRAKKWIHDFLREKSSPAPVELPTSELDAE